MEQDNNLVIIDGHNLLFQMFFGMPNRIYNAQGQMISGTLGFVSAVLKLAKMYNARDLVVVFDSEQQLLNKEENVDYKANRIDYSKLEDEKNPFTQLPFIEKALKKLDICHMFSCGGYEADDYIYSIIKNYKHNYDKVLLVSKDSDFYQLVDDKVSVVNYKGNNSIIMDTQQVIKRYGIKPEQYIFFKAIVGDKADNIKGVYGVGKVTASKLVNQYNDFENFYNNLHNLSNKLQVMFINEKPRLMSNVKIISLQEVAEVAGVEVSDFSYNVASYVRAKDVLKELNIM